MQRIGAGSSQGGNGDRGPGLFVGVFGKHPGWNDHIEDVGLETARLVDVKRRMYVEGIGANIDSGAWDRLEGEQVVDGFAHAFLWRTPGDLVVGRMWSSRDGKGRTKYPMVACLEGAGVPLAWVLSEGLPVLERVQQQCAGTESADAVRAVIDSARSEIRGRAKVRPPGGPELMVSDRSLGELADRPELGRVGVHRLLYHVEREMGDYLRLPHSSTRTWSSELRARQMRVPACGTTPADVLSLWMRAVLSQLGAGVEVLLLHPVGGAWVDLIVGPSEPSAFYCLRASARSLAPVTDVPYDLDPEFVARADRRIAEGRTADDRPIGHSRSAGPAGESRGLLARLAFWRGGAVAILAAVLLFLALAAAAVGFLLEGWGGSRVRADGVGGGPPPGSAPAPGGR